MIRLNLRELAERLAQVRAEEVMARALAEQAGRMADAVRHNLSDPPGAGGHDQPWLQTGALHDSMGATADGLQAAVGSSDPAAAPQEMGTHRMPPRPFLAPVAAGMGEDVARGVGRGRGRRFERRGGRRRRHPCGRVNKRPSPQRPIQPVRRLAARLARERGLDARHDAAPPGPRPHLPFGAGDGEGEDKSGSPEEKGTDPVKPTFKPNEAHNPRNQNYNPSKDPEPPDSEEVY